MSEENAVSEAEVTVPVENEDSAPSEAEETTPDEVSATSEESAGAEEDKPKKSKGGFQQRISELTKQRYEAEQKAQQLEAELTRARQSQVQSEHQTEKPRLEDFNYDQGAWAQAYEQWVQSGYERQAEAQQQAQQQAMQQQQAIQRQAELQAKVIQAGEKYPDFQAKVFDPQLPSLGQLNPAAYEAVVDSEYMADVAYHLANNPAEVYRFAEMTPIQAVKEIARLEARFSSKPKQTTAPPPPSKVSGKSDPVKSPDKMSTEEWMAWRNSQIHGS